jgi:hypothetical protein
MNQIWSLTIDEIIEIQDIARELGRKPGESYEDVLLAYMEIKGRKPLGMTELTKDEMLKEMVSKNNSVLQVDVDKNGKEKYTICKPLDNQE